MGRHLSNAVAGCLVVGLYATLAGCGGDDATRYLSVGASVDETVVGGNAVELTAFKSSADGVVQWQLESGSPGRLDAVSGDKVRYVPDDSVDVRTQVVARATLDGLSTRISLVLHPSPVLSLLAGHIGTREVVDAVGTAARFHTPCGIAADALGNLYVAESVFFPVVRRIEPGGRVTTLAGGIERGVIDGTGGEASFQYVCSIASDASGNVYVVDRQDRGSAVRRVTPAGVVTTLAGGGAAGSADGIGDGAQFRDPIGIAVDPTGTLYVADRSTVRKISPAGETTTLAGVAGEHAHVDGAGTAARFTGLYRLATDRVGNVYLTDNFTIRRITPSGVVSTIAGTPGVAGNADGVGAAAQFGSSGSMDAITVDREGNVLVLDGNQIRKVTPDGRVSTLDVAGGTGVSPTFMIPDGLAVGADGGLYLADAIGAGVRRIDSSGVVSLVAGLPYIMGGQDGRGTEAQFVDPQGLAVESTGELIVTDRSRIRRIDRSGIVTTIDVGGLLYSPTHVATDSDGSIYFIDSGYVVSGYGIISGRSISKIDRDGTGRFLAGANVGATGDPAGLAVDPRGDNIYVAHAGDHVVRRIDSAGVVSVLAGTVGVAGSMDGEGAAASFNSPAGLARDRAGNLYVADSGNHTIRKITPQGVVSTYAGRPGAKGSVDGPTGSAQFDTPAKLAIDEDGGNLYVVDAKSVRKIGRSGMVVTIASIVPENVIPLSGYSTAFYGVKGLAYVGDDTLAIATGNGVVTLYLP